MAGSVSGLPKFSKLTKISVDDLSQAPEGTEDPSYKWFLEPLNIQMEEGIEVGESKYTFQTVLFNDRIYMLGNLQSKNPIVIICDFETSAMYNIELD